MAAKKTENVKMLKVTAPAGGMWRAGMHWVDVTLVPLDTLTEDQVAMIKAEPRFVVEGIDVPVAELAAAEEA